MHRILAPRPTTLLAALLVLAACGGEAPSAGPAVTRLTPEGGDQFDAAVAPDGRSLAWIQRGAEEFELWVQPAGAEPRRLSELGRIDQEPVWSPDGRYVAYASNHQTTGGDAWVHDLEADSAWVVEPSAGLAQPLAWHPTRPELVVGTDVGGAYGCVVVNVTTGARRPQVPGRPVACGAWSPDGSRLAFQELRGQGRGATIWVGDADGAGARQVTTEGHEALAWPPWSPDGTRLLYVSRRTGYGDVWVVPVDGGEPRQLTRDIREDFDPQWSPDGQRVVFVSNRGGQTDLWMVPAGGGPEVRLTDDAELEQWPQWTADGTVLYHAGRPLSRVWRRSLAGGDETALSPEDQSASAPELTPDGRSVAYEVVRTAGVTDLFLVPTEGGTPRALAANAGANEFVRFAPDGGRLTFHSGRAGNLDIWMVDTAGADARPLTSSPVNERNAQWSPDGRTIYFWRASEGQGGDLWAMPAEGGEPRRLTTDIRLFMFWMNPVRDEVYLGHIGPSGAAVLTAFDPATGAMRTLWDRTPFRDIPRYAVSADGRQLLMQAFDAELGFATYVIDLDTGAAQRLGGRRTVPDGLAPDGSYVMLRASRDGQFNPDLQRFTLADSSSTWLTETPQWEGSTRWLPGGDRFVFVRRDLREYIATVAVPSAPPAE